MKSIRSSKLAGLLGAVVLATLLNAGVARAQMCVGDFTLTSETRWGRAILPPGHYTFEMDSTNDRITIRSQDRRVAVMVISLGHAMATQLKSSELILVSRGRKPTVRELRLNPLEEVFSYAVPKENPEQVAQAPSVVQSVPVTLSGK